MADARFEESYGGELGEVGRAGQTLLAAGGLGLLGEDVGLVRGLLEEGGLGWQGTLRELFGHFKKFNNRGKELGGWAYIWNKKRRKYCC